MRAATGFVLSLLIAAPLFAQNSLNNYRKYDLTVEFTSRGGLGGAAGHLSQGFAHGFIANLKTLTRASYTMQDQNIGTREPWSVGFCGLNAAGDPDYANSRLYATNLFIPGSGRGTRSYGVNHLPLQKTPFQVPQSCEQVHHVWRVHQMANWTTDGISCHMSEAAPWQGTLLCGTTASGHREIPRTDGRPAAQIVEGLGWSNVASQKRPAVQTRSWALQLSFDDPVLNGGADNPVYNKNCPNPNWGYASIDPDFNDLGQGMPARTDDYRYTVNAQKFAGGAAVLLWSFTVFPGGGVPTQFGQLHVNLTDPLMGIGPIAMPPIQAWGESSLNLKLGKLNSPFRQAMASMASLTAQAVVVSKAGRVQLTNPFTLRGRMEPPGWKAGTAVAGTPLRLTTNIAQKTLAVRNDGRGVLTLQAYRGNQKIGVATRVCERTAVRVALSPGANAMEIASAKTTATQLVYAFNQ